MNFSSIKLGKPLGKGRFGEVYLSNCGNYAIKKIEKKDFNERGFKFNYAKKLKGCPFVCQTLDQKEDDKHIYLVMEYANSGSLGNYTHEKKRFLPNTCLEILFQIMNGVHFIHENDIIHRNLKPENIFLHTDKERKCVKISGFDDREISNMILALETYGPPFYIAPEILLERAPAYDEKVDIWSVGVMTYQLLTGNIPFLARRFPHFMELIRDYSKKQTSSKEPSSEYILPNPKELDIPDPLWKLVLKMMTVNPLERPSAYDVLMNPLFIDHWKTWGKLKPDETPNIHPISHRIVEAINLEDDQSYSFLV